MFFYKIKSLFSPLCMGRKDSVLPPKLPPKERPLLPYGKGYDPAAFTARSESGLSRIPERLTPTAVSLYAGSPIELSS